LKAAHWYDLLIIPNDMYSQAWDAKSGKCSN
jgi:hypothetical protein